MSNELDELRHIANGGSFDQADAIRMLARKVVGMAADKQAPSATMDAPTATMTAPDAPGEAEATTGAKRKKQAPESSL